MKDPEPPFKLQVDGGAVPLDTGVYIVRRTDAELLQALHQGEYCNVLCARQMGKTSVIFRIRAHLRAEGYRTAYIDIAGRLGSLNNADDWYLGLLIALNSQLELDCNVRKLWKRRTEPTPNQKLLAFFRNEILVHQNQRFVIFLDEIDYTLNFPYTDDFFLAIRSLFNDRAVEPDLCRLAFCLIGVFTPNELIKQQNTTPYNIGRSFELEDFDLERDNLDPLIRSLSSDPSKGRMLLHAVLRWTGGQPYLTVSACQKLVDSLITSPQEVDKLIKETFVSEKPLEGIDAVHFESIARFLRNRVNTPLETQELYLQILRNDYIRESLIPPVVALKLSGLVKGIKVDRHRRLKVRNTIYQQRFDRSWVNNGGFIEDAQPRFKNALDLGQGVLFISHSSKDDAFVRTLRQALEQHGQGSWIDSRELRGGNPLWSAIQQAIENASAYAVVVSPDSLQSKWVGKELRHALEVQKQRGREAFPVIPLLLDGTVLGAFEAFFDEEPLGIIVRSQVDSLYSTLNTILTALGRRLPSDPALNHQIESESLEELVLELTDLKFHEQEGVRRASARARLVYQPANPNHLMIASQNAWRFIAPLGPIEAEELSWYLEKYAIWPSEVFRERARKVEQNLVQWGRDLHEAAMPSAHTRNIMQAWSRIDGSAGRRFSVHVDADLEAGASDSDIGLAREAATLLLGLPWELLHDGEGFLFQGAQPTRVRRRLPNTRVLDVPIVATPIRILLITARPEDEACGYIDHRSSALPLVEAIEALGGLVRLRLLEPATLLALRGELDRARQEGQPYHVIHFDGQGYYDRRVGLGGLCFEDPRDLNKIEGRRHQTVYASELGPLLRDHRIPLVFLEACQTAMSNSASESVGSALLKVGVASVVAMSHSVLVETARRFVQSFYAALARGARVGEAMLEGQRTLKDDSFRGRIFGLGELRLVDWFVPVLFQEKEDPQLFRFTPSKQAQADLQRALKTRLGETHESPPTGFIGRSRELLGLQRLLNRARHAVIRGQSGEGKTALACEFACWRVRSQQVQRTAFVSVEIHSRLDAILDALGRQLVTDYSVAKFADPEQAILPIEWALKEQSTLLVLDNLESLLPPPWLDTPEALAEEGRRELDKILQLCVRLQAQGETRLIFTSREALPAPFAQPVLELHRLAKEDAVKLVERVLNVEYPPGEDRVRDTFDATTEAIEDLVEAVHGHARTLALLAPSIRQLSVDQTRLALVELMADMERKFPGHREQSLYAGAELSLRRLSPENRVRARVLGVFQGGVRLSVLQQMTGWEPGEVASLANELITTGLATANPYNHLSLHPALCPYLRAGLTSTEAEDWQARWSEAMGQYVEFLDQHSNQNAEMTATLTGLELPNLFALLEQRRGAGDPEATIDLATSLHALLRDLGKPRLLERVGQVRDAAAAALGETWTHARFEAQRSQIEQQEAGGRLHEALEGAESLLQCARTAGEGAYPEAGYDLAMAYWLLARVWRTSGQAESALPLLEEARERFETILRERASPGAERMASVCLAERGDCLRDLGRLDEATAAYEENIRRAVQLGDEQQVAVGQGNLGTIRLFQGRPAEALAVYREVRERFGRLDEPGMVAVSWHQTGLAYQALGQPEAAEDAYRQSLAIWVRLGDRARQASTLNQLGRFYDDVLGRPEEAVAFYRRAADLYVEGHDLAKEGVTRSNLADALRTLQRLDEARQAIHRAIECKTPFGHAAEPWTTWNILAAIETDAGQLDLATAARSQARAAYLAYRRAGGENHSDSGRLALAVTQRLQAGDPAAAKALLREQSPRYQARYPSYIPALQAIVAGSRDSELAEAADLDFSMATEILLLIEALAPHELAPPH